MPLDLSGLDQIPSGQRKILKRALGLLFESAGLGPWQVGLMLVDESAMTDLNQAFRGRKTPTDVLSFPFQEDEGAGDPAGIFAHHLGDLAICVDVARAAAREYGHGLVEEIVVLAAHGLFHLLGLDHERGQEEARRQLECEASLLAQAGFPPALSLIARMA
jgi:probable rRNA maturation factor